MKGGVFPHSAHEVLFCSVTYAPPGRLPIGRIYRRYRARRHPAEGVRVPEKAPVESDGTAAQDIHQQLVLFFTIVATL
jgi:hypothetical protein